MKLQDLESPTKLQAVETRNCLNLSDRVRVLKLRMPFMSGGLKGIAVVIFLFQGHGYPRTQAHIRHFNWGALYRGTFPGHFSMFQCSLMCAPRQSLRQGLTN